MLHENCMLFGLRSCHSTVRQMVWGSH